MRLTALLAIVCVATALVAGCATPPPFRYYTLSATAAPYEPASSLVVALGPVLVPAAVDRPEIVVRTGPNEVRLDDFNRWVSPLQDNLSQVIAEDLALSLGTPRVTRSSQPLAANADYRVAVDVRSFESTLGESASLDAIWTIHRTKDKKMQTGHTFVRESVADASYQAIAGAHSRAAARMSRDIAEAIRALQRDAP